MKGGFWALALQGEVTLDWGCRKREMRARRGLHVEMMGRVV